MTTAADKLRTIRCTGCGAAEIDLHGGRHVKSIVCKVCSAVLDAQDEYKVLDKFVNAQRPYTPIEIGASGTIKGVEFTVIGLVQYESQAEEYGGAAGRALQTWAKNFAAELGEDFEAYVPTDGSWIELLLYSPTHGYAYLEYDDQHFVFSRRIRDLPKPATPGTRAAPRKVRVRDQLFKDGNSYTARITFVEGELSWIARADQKVRLTEAYDPPFGFAYEQTNYELEYLLSEYLPTAEVEQAFGLEALLQPNSVHPTQPYVPKPWVESLRRTAKPFALASLVMVIVTWIGFNGSAIYNALWTDSMLRSVSQPLTITRDTGFVSLETQRTAGTSRGDYAIRLRRDGDLIAELGPRAHQATAPHRVSAWNSSSIADRAYLKLAGTGPYEVEVRSTGGQPMRLKIEQAKVPVRYLLGLCVFLMLIWMLAAGGRRKHEARRRSAIYE